MKKVLFLSLFMVIAAGLVFAQSITVISPNGGESWSKMSPVHTVSWTSTGVTGNVIIQLMQGGASQGAIYNGPNTGTFPWTINTYLSSSPIALGSYRLQVKSLNDPSILDQSNGDFTITAAPTGATVMVKSPLD